ncbi:MAG: nickel-dependent lactate racemase [Anaerolineae bacterium]|nr:nickel-dependent lactate racemase [Anaerolineae bacterium]
MRVGLAYGEGTRSIEVPDDATVLLPRQVAGILDERGAIVDALRCPPEQRSLRERVSPHDRVAVVFSDITRPMPNARVLPALLDELAHIPPEQIVLINGLGTHRAQTEEELARMLGRDLVARYAIEQHDAWNADRLVDLGETRYGHRALVNRTYVEATFRIVTGFIEPHIFAGFSGGPKAVLPGIAGIGSIMDNHGYAMLSAPTATWGITEGNPVWEEISQVGQLARPDLMLNVTLNRRREITGVFAGEMMATHRQGIEFVRSSAMVPVEAPFDIVVTSNSGYPLDINLYQAVKGMSCAAQIVKPGGSILIASECRDGVPDYGEYRNLMHEGGSPAGVLDLISQPGFRRHDQWEAQLHAQILQLADIHVYSDYLSDEETRGMLCEPCHDLDATLASLLGRHGAGARVCVLPEGPQTIPFVATR